MKLRRIILSVFIVTAAVCSTASFSKAENSINIVITKNGDRETNLQASDLVPGSCAKKVYDTLNATVSQLGANTVSSRFREIKGYFRLKVDNPTDGTIGKILVYTSEPATQSTLEAIGSWVTGDKSTGNMGCSPLHFNDSSASTCYSSEPAPTAKEGCNKILEQINKDGLYRMLYDYMGTFRHNFRNVDSGSPTDGKSTPTRPTNNGIPGRRPPSYDPAHATDGANQ
jgi:hypothetical protein